MFRFSATVISWWVSSYKRFPFFDCAKIFFFAFSSESRNIWLFLKIFSFLGRGGGSANIPFSLQLFLNSGYFGDIIVSVIQGFLYMCWVVSRCFSILSCSLNKCYYPHPLLVFWWLILSWCAPSDLGLVDKWESRYCFHTPEIVLSVLFNKQLYIYNPKYWAVSPDLNSRSTPFRAWWIQFWDESLSPRPWLFRRQSIWGGEEYCRRSWCPYHTF